MTTPQNFTVKIAKLPDDLEALRAIREAVFIVEQKVPKDLEWDGLDGEAIHALAVDQSGQPVGTARLLPSGQIGRMAVMKPWRSRGTGRALLTSLLNAAKAANMTGIYLNAQKEAIQFYEKQGFQVTGPEFYEANIPHQKMEIPSE
ncbi:MAG: GNAT family N-acetyltransferase [Aestuariibacter sp.]|nr:GNAT family N-acetyltransferase [Aestuariibacter sp.]